MTGQVTLSRVAERIYWLGRYLERAENTSRLIRAHANTLIDLPTRPANAWHPLLVIMGSDATFAATNRAPTEQAVVRFLTGDASNPGSIVSSLTQARENARTVRETMPRATFEYINGTYQFARDSFSGQLSRARRAEALSGVDARIHRLDGFLSTTMLHGTNWEFLRMGAYLERADMTSRIIDVSSMVPSEVADTFESLHWRSILHALNSLSTYLMWAQEPVNASRVLEFLFLNEQLPRSMLRNARAIHKSLRPLPRNERPLRACNQVIRHLRDLDLESLDARGLHDTIDDCQRHLAQLHDAIEQTYFHFKPRRRRTAQSQSQSQARST